MRKQIVKFDKNMEEVKGLIKLGGYYRWDWKFPFRHFIKEEMRFMTTTGIYKVVEE